LENIFPSFIVPNNEKSKNHFLKKSFFSQPKTLPKYILALPSSIILAFSNFINIKLIETLLYYFSESITSKLHTISFDIEE